MSQDTIVVKRFYGLRIASLIYKGLTYFTVLFMVGGLGFVTLQTLEMSGSYANAVTNWWLPRVLILVIVSLMLSLTFFVLSQLIDVQLYTNDSMRQLADNMNQTLSYVKTLKLATQVKSSEGVQIDVKTKG